MLCPRCQEPLTRYRAQAGLVWQCQRCGGRAVALSVLRKAVEPGLVRSLWVAATQGGVPSPLPCPSCRLPMKQAPSVAHVPAAIDVCERCQFVWTDAGELELMPPAPPEAKPQEPELPPEAKEALALAKVEALSERARRLRHPADDIPDNAFQAALAILGLPVEEENFLQRLPWATWLTAFTVVAISLMAFVDMERALRQLALIPAEWWRYGGLTLFTSFFVHGSLFHLVTNLYFLVVFGDNVEDFLGHGRFVVLLVLATLGGDALHILLEPRSDVPCIGASGGISGLVAFYALCFPHARFIMAYRGGFFSLSAWQLALLWAVIQVIGAFQQVAGVTDFSALAHLGGAATGAVCWLLWRQRGDEVTGVA
ncbi:MAG: rhomboid family intramembrane serine protease [Armatimonadota bacterium]|nr:rhomboid family intramembrane serine protease [Armatimonadota bacterium]